MLVTPIYKGMGLGNQLHNYVTCRSLALDKGYDFGIAFPENFKGKDFMNLDMGKKVEGLIVPIEGQEPTQLPEGYKYYKEISSDYDQFIFNIPDNYVIHGNLQGEKYFEKNKDKIREWLKVEQIFMEDNLCILAFRGGEYRGVKDFFLPQSYWIDAMENMRMINPDIEFHIVTDDIETAQEMLSWVSVSHEISSDWRMIRYAKYLILSNSSFGWLPAWLGNAKKIIAPLYWQRFNKKFWLLEQNKTKGFWYQDDEGNLEQL